MKEFWVVLSPFKRARWSRLKQDMTNTGLNTSEKVRNHAVEIWRMLKLLREVKHKLKKKKKRGTQY